MNVVNGILGVWQRTTCSHRWVRARWDDGSYGMRCANCMKAYPRTWDDLIEGPAGDASRPNRAAAADLTPLRRAA